MNQQRKAMHMALEVLRDVSEGKDRQAVAHKAAVALAVALALPDARPPGIQNWLQAESLLYVQRNGANAYEINVMQVAGIRDLDARSEFACGLRELLEHGASQPGRLTDDEIETAWVKVGSTVNPYGASFPAWTQAARWAEAALHAKQTKGVKQ